MLEEMNAIRNSLAGTANMAADGWCVPMQTAYLFPEHPMAKEWGTFSRNVWRYTECFIHVPK